MLEEFRQALAYFKLLALIYFIITNIQLHIYFIKTNSQLHIHFITNSQLYNQQSTAHIL